MSQPYQLVSWTRQKLLYDAWVAAGVAVFLFSFICIGRLRPDPTPIGHLVLRALGSCALTMVHVVLWIGPLARLSPRLLVVLHNRRHLGVATCLVAIGHAVCAVVVSGAANSLAFLSLHTESTRRGNSAGGIRFETLGFAALAVLVLMASTSHDFWNRNLSPRWWKWLHMSVYAAYGLLILHGVFGAMITQHSISIAVLLIAGVVITTCLHTAAGGREGFRDGGVSASLDGFVDVCGVNEIPDSRAKVVCPRGSERIAVFREGDRYFAVSNVCAHQNGPVGEGVMSRGCITCPWHGWQYRAEDGRCPPPFTDRIDTYDVRVRGGRVQVCVRARTPGAASNDITPRGASFPGAS